MFNMFNSIRGTRPKLNKFNLSHEKKLSMNMGDLVPIYLQEVVPGDRFRVSSEIMMRLAPMLAPVMHRVNVWTHYFFVPNRIVWSEWEDFITGGEDGDLVPVHPYVDTNWASTFGLATEGSLWDYFGLPVLTGTLTADSVRVSQLPFRGYATIFNEYYRDQSLQDKLTIQMTSGSTAQTSNFAVQRRCWEKDYFTSALPFPQRGDAVTIPGLVNYSPIGEVVDSQGDPVDAAGLSAHPSHDAAARYLVNTIAGEDFGNLHNLDEIGIDINDLRRSNALQRFLELAARGGSRYIEIIKSMFGITSSDARLQRPEYLGGGMQNVVISEVLQTTPGDSPDPLGSMGGHGVSVGRTNQFKKGPFEEHGFVIGICSVLPRTGYQQGVNRMWRRQDKFDYFWPQFAHLGEQAILNTEIFHDDTQTQEEADSTWGYQSRYAEYKYMPSTVHGDFRSSLNYWHMSRIFDSAPPLNGDFVSSDPTHRIFANADPDDEKLWVQIYNRVDALRPMPYYGTPRL